MLIGLLWIWDADEWYYEYYEGSTIVFLLNVIVMNGLYEYDQGSTIILYWM
jgi:hypothetical protein